MVDVSSYGRWELTAEGWRLRPPAAERSSLTTPVERYRDAGVM